MPSSTTAELRQRQAKVVEQAILDALADRLETTDPEAIALADLAVDAGVSLRTLYRYFPTREALFDAVGDTVVARLGLPQEIRTPDDIVPVFLESARLGAQSPKLMRAMLSSRLGQRARSQHRRRRVTRVTAALSAITGHLDAAEAERRVGAIVYLTSLAAWLTISQECEISAEDARLGAAWAIDTLITALKDEGSQPSGGHHD